MVRRTASVVGALELPCAVVRLLSLQVGDAILHARVPNPQAREQQQNLDEIRPVEGRKCQLGQLGAHRLAQIVTPLVHSVEQPELDSGRQYAPRFLVLEGLRQLRQRATVV